MTSHIRSSREGSTLVLTLARPRARNALDLAMYEALTEALEHAAVDPEVRAVLVEGEGDGFCAGNDLKDFLDNPPTGRFHSLCTGS